MTVPFIQPLIFKKSSTSAFSFPYDIPYGCRFNATPSYIYSLRAASPTTTDAKKCTFNTWFKKTTNDTYQAIISCIYSGAYYNWIYFDQATNKLKFVSYVNSVTIADVITEGVFTDCRNWHNLHFELDTTQGTGSNRIKIWVDGVQQVLTFNTTPGQNTVVSALSFQTWNTILGSYNTVSYNLDGYLAHTRYFDGTIVPYTEFGTLYQETWVPKEFAGGYSYGNLGYEILYEDSGNLGNDTSGNNMDLATATAVVRTGDTPTNNYAVINANDTSGVVVSRAGLRASHVTTSWAYKQLTFLLPETGKWQVEFAFVSGAANFLMLGLVDDTMINTTYPGDTNNGISYQNNGPIRLSGSTLYTGTAWDAGGEIAGAVYDADAETVTFYMNGVEQYTVDASSLGLNRYFCVSTYNTGVGELNNGANGFDYPVAGANALCFDNIPQVVPNYEIPYSCLLESTDWFGANRLTSSTGHRNFIISVWVYCTTLGGYICSAVNNGTVDFDDFQILAAGGIRYRSRTSSTYEIEMVTKDGYIKANTWHHVFLAINTTLASSSDRVRMWVDGIEINSWATTTRPGLDYTVWWNRNGSAIRLGQRASTGYFQGYMANFEHKGNGNAFPDDFGRWYNNKWIPKGLYTGLWGTWGFQLLFANAADLGNDTSGNNNDFPVQNTPAQSTFTPTS